MNRRRKTISINLQHSSGFGLGFWGNVCALPKTQSSLHVGISQGTSQRRGHDARHRHEATSNRLSFQCPHNDRCSWNRHLRSTSRFWIWHSTLHNLRNLGWNLHLAATGLQSTPLTYLDFLRRFLEQNPRVTGAAPGPPQHETEAL